MAGSDIHVGIDGFQGAIQRVLEEFKKSTEDDIVKATDETAKEVRKRTAGASPRLTGKYKSGWTTRVTGAGIGNHQRTVYNRSRASLTHLLQKGHRIRNQYGSYGSVSARPHITPDAETEQIFVKKFKALMER